MFDSKPYFFHQPFLLMTTPRSFFRSAALAATLLCLFSLAFSGTSDFADKGTACTTESVGNFDDGGVFTATPTLAADLNTVIATDNSATFQTEEGANEATSCTAGLANARTDQTQSAHAVFAVTKIGDQCCANGGCHAVSKNVNWEQSFANSQHTGTAFIPTSSALYSRWMNSASARTTWTATDGAAFARNSWQQNCTAALLKDATPGAVSTNNFANGNSTSTCGIPGDTASVAFNQNSGGMHTMGDYNSGQGVSQADFSGADYGGQCMVLSNCNPSIINVSTPGDSHFNFQRAG